MDHSKLNRLIAQLSKHATALEFVRTHAEEFSEEFVQEIFEEVDESPFSLVQWFQSFEVIEAWLSNRRERARVVDQLGYVSCAGWTVATSFAETTLPEVVSEMLTEHGFENAY